MLGIQKEYLDYMGEVKDRLKDVESLANSLDSTIDDLKFTEMLVPVVGAFSSGKSTLINSFLGDEYLPVGITPETSLATEIRFSEKNEIEAIRADNIVDRYDMNKKDMKKIKNNARNYKHIRVFLNNEEVKEIAPIIIVDMPGFDSPLDLHNQAILEYINKGVHYMVLTSVEEGNITNSMIRQLSDINEFGRDFNLFLSKANLRSTAEVEEIATKIEEQIEENFDMRKKIVPVGLDDGNSLKDILEEINPNDIFKNLFSDRIKEELYSILSSINTKMATYKKSKADNENAIKELSKGIEQLEKRRDSMLNEAKEKYSNINVDKIVDAVGRDLTLSLEELTTTAKTSGVDIFSQRFAEIIRHSLIPMVKDVICDINDDIVKNFSLVMGNLENVLTSYSIDNNILTEVIGSSVDVIKDFNNSLTEIVSFRKTKTDAGKMYKTVTSILAITTSIINPVLEVIIVFLPDIISGILNFIQDKKVFENIENHILNVAIPSVKQELRIRLYGEFNSEVENIINNIYADFNEKLSKKKDEIDVAEKEKENKLNKIDQEIMKYKEKRNFVLQITAKIS